MNFKKEQLANSAVTSNLGTNCKSTKNLQVDFSKVCTDTEHQLNFSVSLIATLLGDIITISDRKKLYLLKFADSCNLEIEISKLGLNQKISTKLIDSAPVTMIRNELNLYFSGKLSKFQTPLHLAGTDFQKKAWNALINVPYGQTKSYLQQAKAVGNEKAFRAVANANSMNKFVIVIPCHRIIKNSGDIGGYSGRSERKAWLINHEKRYV
ncbi:MAG: methylated-DNA--[protein]-cysteine S-methyltransferase [Alphaproteobacteria bacterium]|nr:MAG: methylated-DNA--[protein]-cysteine S-methyltransferase [Alphaproteobacteria bacterium]